MGWLVGWLIDWLLGWLLGCLVAWLVGWLVVKWFEQRGQKQRLRSLVPSCDVVWVWGVGGSGVEV